MWQAGLFTQALSCCSERPIHGADLAAYTATLQDRIALYSAPDSATCFQCTAGRGAEINNAREREGACVGIGHSLGLDTGSALCSLEGVRRGMDSAEDDGVGGLKWDHSDETTDLAEVNAPPAEVTRPAGEQSQTDASLSGCTACDHNFSQMTSTLHLLAACAKRGKEMALTAKGLVLKSGAHKYKVGTKCFTKAIK